MKKTKRILALLLILTMCLSLLPLSAFAEEDAWADEVPAVEQEDEPGVPEPEEPEEAWETLAEEEPCEHEALDPVIENAAAPKCTEPGSHDEVVYCALCGAELSRETVEDPAPGHVPEDAEEIPPQPGVPGRGAGVICAVCGEALEGCEALDALPEEELAAQEDEIAAQADPTGIPIDETNFPDDIFRDYVRDNVAGGDTLTEGMIAGCRQFDLSDMDIGDLRGIGFFTALEVLDCSGNGLTELDLSGLSALTYLDCSSNALTALDLSGLTALTLLDCSSNALTALDLSGCSKLRALFCGGNELTELTLSGCSALTLLQCADNKLAELDLDDCIALYSLNCRNNEITELDLNSFVNLAELECAGNPLSELELSGCTGLTQLTLTKIPTLTELELSGCTGLKTLDCSGNALTELMLRNCSELVNLNCSDNALTRLNVSGCTSLKTIDCSNNALETLNASGCADLDYLDCQRNALTTLNLSGCMALKRLDCSGNALTELNVSGYSKLVNLNCANNELAVLNASGCTALEYLDCADNGLSALDLSGCGTLSSLECEGNALSALDLGDCAGLATLYCANNALTELDLSVCTALKTIDCANNALSALDVSVCPDLTWLVCTGNGLTALDLSECPALASCVEYGVRTTGVDAYGNSWIRFEYGVGDRVELDESVARNVLIPAPFPPAAFTLSASYRMMEAGEQIPLLTAPPEDPTYYPYHDPLFPAGTDTRWADRIEWAAAREDGTLPDDPLEVEAIWVEDGVLYAEAPGAACVVALIRDENTGEILASALCRIDVTLRGGEAVEGVRLTETKATVELYKNVYPTLTLIPILEQNVDPDAVDFELLDPTRPDDATVILSGANFTDPEVSRLFGVHIVDDRTLEIYPRVDPNDAEYLDLNDADAVKAVKGSYKSTIAVTFENNDGPDPEEGKTYYETQEVTLTVKKSLPKVTAKAGKLNSFLPGSTQDVVFSVPVTSAEPDTAKENPDWLRFDANYLSVTYVGEPELKSVSGKLYLKVQPEGWNVKIPVTVSVSAANSAPKLSVKPGSVSLNPAVSMRYLMPSWDMTVQDSASVTLTAKPAEFVDYYTLVPEVISVTEGKNEAPNALSVKHYVWDTFDFSPGPGAPTDGKAHTYKVTIALTRNGVPSSARTTATVKLLAASTKISVSAKVSGAIDTAIPGSYVEAALTVKGVTSPTFGRQDVMILRDDGEDVTGDFDVYFILSGLNVRVRPRDGFTPQAGRTYTLTVSKDFGTASAECSVKLPIKFSDPAKVQPSATLKAKGAIDVIRPDSSVVLTPTVKNCPSYWPQSGDLIFWRKDGKNFVPITEEEDNPFSVSVENGAYVVTLRPDAQVDHTTKKFNVSLNTVVRDEWGQKIATLVSKPVAVTLKMGGAKITQSAKNVKLLMDDRFDQAVITLTPEAGLADIDWDRTREAFVSPLDKNKREAFELIPLGGGSAAIAYKRDPLIPGFLDSPEEPFLPAEGFKGGTVKIPVFLVGNESEKPNATISVSVKLA